MPTGHRGCRTRPCSIGPLRTPSYPLRLAISLSDSRLFTLSSPPRPPPKCLRCRSTTANSPHSGPACEWRQGQELTTQIQAPTARATFGSSDRQQAGSSARIVHDGLVGRRRFTVRGGGR